MLLFAAIIEVMMLMSLHFSRWGDAPVHSVAVALLVPEHQVHFFNDIGYTVKCHYISVLQQYPYG